MSRPIYRAGEVDEDAYGPPATDEPLPPKPKWRPKGDPEKEAFTSWCLAMLDRNYGMDDLEAALSKLEADDTADRLLRQVADQKPFHEARKLLPHLTWSDFEKLRYGPQVRQARTRKATGRKSNAKVAAARIDNARLTVIWKEHFGGQDRRPCLPSRLDILQRRHALTPGELATVDNYLSKAKI